MAWLMRACGAVPRLSLRRSTFCTLMREPTVVGLKADPNARETLKNLYQQAISAVSDLPEDAAYRRNVIAISEYRMGVVESAADIEDIEKQLGVGQIEEVIEQANDELDLIPYMAKWQPWATAEGASPAKIEVID